MSQQGGGVPEEGSTHGAQGPVDGQVLLVEGSGGAHELLSGELGESVQGPAQVHRRRSAGEEHLSGLVQVTPVLSGHGQPIGGGDGDGWGAAYDHALNGLGDLGRVGAAEPLLGVGQSPLVEELQVLVSHSDGRKQGGLVVAEDIALIEEGYSISYGGWRVLGWVPSFRCRGGHLGLWSGG